MTKNKFMIGYLVAMIDGEGYLCISGRFRSKRYPNGITNCQVGITNCSYKMLRCLQKNFGGNINTINPGNAGFKNRKPIWRLLWSGHKAKEFLRPIQKLFLIKKKQVEIFMEFPLHKSGIKKLTKREIKTRNKLYLQMKILNGRKMGKENIHALINQ